jgi:hypothetical protein
MNKKGLGLMLILFGSITLSGSVLVIPYVYAQSSEATEAILQLEVVFEDGSRKVISRDYTGVSLDILQGGKKAQSFIYTLFFRTPKSTDSVTSLVQSVTSARVQQADGVFVNVVPAKVNAIKKISDRLWQIEQGTISATSIEKALEGKLTKDTIIEVQNRGAVNVLQGNFPIKLGWSSLKVVGSIERVVSKPLPTTPTDNPSAIGISVKADKGEYRGGNIVYIDVKTFNVSNGLDATADVTVSVISANGNVVTQFTKRSFGLMQTTYTIPSNAALGTWSVVASVSSKAEQTGVSSTAVFTVVNVGGTVKTCADGTVVARGTNCPTPPSPPTTKRCGDGLVIPIGDSCPEFKQIQCPDGSFVSTLSNCPPTTNPVQPPTTKVCQDGSVILETGECRTAPDFKNCDGGIVVGRNESCPSTNTIVCNDGKVVSKQSDCLAPSGNRQCADGTSVPVSQQCPIRTGHQLCPDGTIIPMDEFCIIFPTSPTPPSSGISGSSLLLTGSLIIGSIVGVFAVGRAVMSRRRKF